MSEKTKFSKREWIHLIITLSIVQAAIWFVSFVYANNSSALGYISFAGTIISIILAVLAIGYTYGESQQQKNSSSTLGNQIESLIKIKDKLEIQAEALEDIKELKSNLTRFSENVDNYFRETNQHVTEVKSNLILMSKISVSENNEININSIQDSFFKGLEEFDNPLTIIVFSLLGIFFDKDKEVNSYEELIGIINNSDYLDFNYLSKDILVGGSVMTCNLLILNNFVNKSNGRIIINEEFINYLKICEKSLNQRIIVGFNDDKLKKFQCELNNTRFFI